jgi:hypothetical protein
MGHSSIHHVTADHRALAGLARRLPVHVVPHLAMVARRRIGVDDHRRGRRRHHRRR